MERTVVWPFYFLATLLKDRHPPTAPRYTTGAKSESGQPSPPLPYGKPLCSCCLILEVPKFPGALINLHERCLHTPTVPVHASDYHSPRRLYSQVQLGFSSQAFAYLLSLEDSNLLPCSEWALCAINLLSGQSTALQVSERGLASFLLLVWGYLEGQDRGGDSSRLKRGTEDFQGLEYCPGLSILDCSFWNAVE